MEHLCSLWSRWESDKSCHCCLACKQYTSVWCLVGVLLLREMRIVILSDTEIDTFSLFAKNTLKVSLVYTVEANWQFHLSENPRKLQFAVSSQPVITRRTVSSHPRGTHSLISSLHELPGKPWWSSAQLQAGSNALLRTDRPKYGSGLPLPLAFGEHEEHPELQPHCLEACCGNHRLDANHLCFHTSLFGQGCSCLKSLLDGCCPAAGTSSFPSSLSAKRIYCGNRCGLMLSSSRATVLQAIRFHSSTPGRLAGEGLLWCSRRDPPNASISCWQWVTCSDIFIHCCPFCPEM